MAVIQLEAYRDRPIEWRHECACGGQQFECVAVAPDVLGGELQCLRCGAEQRAVWVYPVPKDDDAEGRTI